MTGISSVLTAILERLFGFFLVAFGVYQALSQYQANALWWTGVCVAATLYWSIAMAKNMWLWEYKRGGQ